MTRHDGDIGMHTIGIRSTAPSTCNRLSVRSERRYLAITMCSGLDSKKWEFPQIISRNTQHCRKKNSSETAKRHLRLQGTFLASESHIWIAARQQIKWNCNSKQSAHELQVYKGARTFQFFAMLICSQKEFQ